MSKQDQTASTNAMWIAILSAVVIALIVLAGLRTIWNRAKQPQNTRPLLAWVAASQRAPMEQAAQEYGKQYGVRIEIAFGGSQSLLANIELSKKGELFVPADDSYVVLAQEQNLLAETFPLARMTARLAVAKGNPKKLHTLADLKAGDVKLAQANPDAAAIGKLIKAALQPTGQWAALEARTIVFKPNVSDVANDVKLGTADAAFVWDAMAPLYPGLDFIRLPELESVQANVAVAVLKNSPQAPEALRFARWLSDREKGLKIWQQHGYALPAGNP